MSLLRLDRVTHRHRPVTGGQRSRVPESRESIVDPPAGPGAERDCAARAAARLLLL